MAVSSLPTLTPNDTTILSALFDPETLPTNTSASPKTAPINPSLPSHPTIPSSVLQSLESEQKTLIAPLNTDSPSQDLIKSVKAAISQTITTNPTYPSAYLNRAQVTRLLLETSSTNLFSPSNKQFLNSIFTDLTTAINLSAPQSPSTPISPYTSLILQKAHSHLAYLYLKASETPELFSAEEMKGERELPKDIANRSKSELEDMASKQFSKAAWYGDPVAREMSVRTNPYAKMCGAIVREAIEEERRGAGFG